MPVTSVVFRESGRTLPHDTHHQSSSPLVLRPAAIERLGGLPSNDTSLPHDTPRLSTVAARTRTVRLGTESAQAQSGVLDLSSNSPVLDGSHVSDDEYSPPQRGNVGPVRSAKSHSRRQPPGHIPRPRNAFILYRSWYVKQVNRVENDHREISRIVGKLWKGETEEVREHWRGLAEEEKKVHALKHPNYKYSPNSRRDGAPLPTRTSTARSRKVKAKVTETLPNGRPSGVAEAFSLRSHRRDLEDRIQTEDEHTSRDVTANAGNARSGQLEINVQPPSPQPSQHLGDVLNSFPVSTSPTPTSSQAHTGQAEDDPQWSLAACSAPLADPQFTLDTEASNSRSMFDPFGLESVSPSPFRQGFSGAETLNTIMSCDDLTTGQSNNLASDSTFYHQYSVTAATENDQPRSGVLPFNHIVAEGSQPGYLHPALFDAPFDTLSADHDFTGSYFDQLQRSALASGFQPFTDTMVGDSSTQDQSDASFFEQFCPLDSPVFGDDAQTPTASTSSGAPSPPLPLECPTPTYPQRTGLLHSWAADCEDLDAYRYAAGGIQAELDDYSTIFGMNGLATGRE